MDVEPRGEILRPDLGDGGAYNIHEEVPRAGAVVTRTYQRTRWYDGKTYLWLGRRKQAGRGEGSSGLKFDQIEPIEREASQINRLYTSLVQGAILQYFMQGETDGKRRVEGACVCKDGRVPTKSEGPDYYLQTEDAEYFLVLNEREAWVPDYELEYYCRRICEVAGEHVKPGMLVGNLEWVTDIQEAGKTKVIKVATIKMTGEKTIRVD